MEKGIKAIEDTIASLGRTKQSVLIVAATKTIEAERINSLKDYGIFDAGENKVQELMQKVDDVSGMRWHFIGNLQKNKVKYIVGKVCLIHSVCDISLACEIAKRAKKIGKTIDVLAEINIGNEPTKGGVTAGDLFTLCDGIIALEGIRLRGLMTVMPEEANETLYKKMRTLYFEARERYGYKSDTTNVVSLLENIEQVNVLIKKANAASIDFLSMGMSNDYGLALRYGANIIRPGSAIFGKRNYGG